MSNYIVISELVGTPGETYTPDEGINVEALIEGGFIKTDSKTKTAKTED
jgi:hypothetical protein